MLCSFSLALFILLTILGKRCSFSPLFGSLGFFIPEHFQTHSKPFGSLCVFSLFSSFPNNKMFDSSRKTDPIRIDNFPTFGWRWCCYRMDLLLLVAYGLVSPLCFLLSPLHCICCGSCASAW